MDHFEKQEAEHLPTTVTDEDIANAIEDEHGAKYSPDGKRLLQGADIGTYEIKAGTEVISDRAFEYCTSLWQITIPSSVTAIGEGAFLNCTSLRQINIPDSVTSIGGGAFSYCTSLEQITIHHMPFAAFQGRRQCALQLRPYKAHFLPFHTEPFHHTRQRDKHRR